jgi:hypothetical protein
MVRSMGLEHNIGGALAAVAAIWKMLAYAVSLSIAAVAAFAFGANNEPRQSG